MAMQAGMGLSGILLLLGAGYTGMIVLRNGWLSDILGEEVEKSPGASGADSVIADALALQVRRLAMEVRQLAYARPITVLNGSGQAGITAHPNFLSWFRHFPARWGGQANHVYITARRFGDWIAVPVGDVFDADVTWFFL